jgi:raffinose/stachyose/melibiose transport system substrate-binding protein
MISRRQFAVGAAGLAGAAALGACSNKSGATGSNENATRPDGYPDLKWTGTIVMGAQAYTPALPGVKLAPGTPKLKAFGQIADDFSKLYPGIKLKFLGSEYKYDPDQMKTQATGGQLPDVWWQQSDTVNSNFPAGIVTNLMDIAAKPNPFLKGNKTFIGEFSPQVLSMAQVDDKTLYTNNADYVGTAFFYNKEMFDNAGITAAPTTYQALLDDMQKLKDKGYMPSALPGYAYGFSWLCRLFLPNFLGIEACKKMAAYDGINAGISTTDMAVSYKKGILDARKNDAVLAWWPHAKDFFAFCDPTITAQPALPPTGAPTPEKMMAAKKVAMIYDGTWAPTTIKAAGTDITIGSFKWPSLAGIDPHATDLDTSACVGGPAAAWQYNMSTERSDSSLKEKGKKEAVTAWMQFFTTPERNSKVCNEYGSFLPTLVGSKPSKEMADLAEIISQPIYGITAGQSFTTESADQINKLFQQYVLGQVDLNAVQQKYPDIIDKGFNEYIKAHPIDFSKYPD